MLFKNKNFVYYLSLICITILPDAIKADGQTANPPNVAQVANTLIANPQIEAKISQDAEHFRTGLFSQNHPSVVALPDQILFYTKAFADRVGLQDRFIVPLDPAIAAIQVYFKRVLVFDYDSRNSFVQKYGLDHLTPQQQQLFEAHLAALPILFRHEKMPLHVHYDCYINLYLNDNNQRVNHLQTPDKPVWWNSDALINKMLAPIQKYQVTAAQDPDLKQAANNNPNQLIANYNAYIKNTLHAPQAVLTQTTADWKGRNLGNQTPVIYNGHFTHFFPGVNYLSFQVPYCKILESSRNSPGIWLWIQKAQTQGSHANDFYAFHIPSTVTSAAALQEIKHLNQGST